MAQILLPEFHTAPAGAPQHIELRNLTMSDKNPTTSTEDSRREFLNRAGKVAVTAPAVALLLAASTRASQAQVLSGRPT